MISLVIRWHRFGVFLCFMLAALFVYTTSGSFQASASFWLPTNYLYAVVIPIVGSGELNRFRAQLRYWTKDRYPGGAAPCDFDEREGSLSFARGLQAPDLVLLTASHIDERSKELAQREFRANPQAHRCFRRLRILTCGMEKDFNEYAMNQAGFVMSRYNGPLLFFMCMISHRELAPYYRYAFLMELDAAPLRNNWLPVVESDARRLAATNKIIMYGGCANQTNTNYSGWLNGSPALYRLGNDAVRQHWKCISTFRCRPLVPYACRHTWDSYLVACARAAREDQRAYLLSCHYIHIGSVWHAGRGTRNIAGFMMNQEFRNATIMHSMNVVKELSAAMARLEQSVASEHTRLYDLGT